MQIKTCLAGSPPCAVSFHELQENISQCLSIATHRCNMETQHLQNDRNCSTVTPILELCKRRKGQEFATVIMRSNDVAGSAGSENRLLTCSGCYACLDFLRLPGCTHHKWDFRKCYIRLLWEMTDTPSTISELNIGSISQFRELLKAASRYAAEAGDVVSYHNSTKLVTRADLPVIGQAYHPITRMFTELPGALAITQTWSPLHWHA